MKTSCITLLLACAALAHATDYSVPSIIEVTSTPVPMIPNGKTDISVAATPPPGMRIVKVLIFLEPIPPPSIDAILHSPTNAIDPLKLELELKRTPLQKKEMKNLTFGEPKLVFPGERPQLFRLSLTHRKK